MAGSSAWANAPSSVREPPPSQQQSSLELGSTVRAHLAGGGTIDAQVFAHDDKAGLYALTSPGSKPQSSAVRFVPKSALKSVTKLQKAPDSLGNETLPDIDQNAMNARIQSTIRNMHEEAACVKEMVSQPVQDLFDSLYRVYHREIRWDGEHIVAFDCVRIVPPYSENDCYAESNDANEAMFAQLKKHLAARGSPLQQQPQHANPG